MSINFPNSPLENATYTVDNRTWQWTGVFWRAISTTVGFTGSQGPAGGYQGSKGDYGPQGYGGSVGFTGSASTVVGYTGSRGETGVRGFTGSLGDIGYTGSLGTGIPVGGSPGQVIVKNSGSNYDLTWGYAAAAVGLSPWFKVIANYTAGNGDRIIADTTAGSFTITLPAAPATGNYVQITDGGGWATNHFIINRNGKNIEGYSDNISVDISDTTIELIYDGVQWQITSTTGAEGPPGQFAGRGYDGCKGEAGYIGSQGASLTPWFIVTSNYTAANLDRIIANTTAGSFAITLPAAPETGDYIQITDGASFLTHNLTIVRNGNAIEGYTQDVLIDINSTTVEILYDGTQWQLTSTTGAQGPVGYTGSRGAADAIGYTGCIGYTGSQGAGFGGSVGYNGSRGEIGYTGSFGFTGSVGVGYGGSRGYTGSKGYTGSYGFTGSQGEIGYSGSVGTGYDGSIGDVGYTGCMGGPGYTGSKGTSSFTYGDSPPGSPVIGDWWMDTTLGINFMWTFDGTSYQWVEMAASGFQGPIGYSGSRGTAGYDGSVGLSGSYAGKGYDGSVGYTGSQGSIGRSIAAAIIFGG